MLPKKEHANVAGMASTTYRRAIEMMEADIGTELVALDMEEGRTFGFNEVAADVWRNLAEPKSFDQLRDELLREYDVSVERCTQDLQDLLNEMIAQGLVEQSS